VPEPAESLLTHRQGGVLTLKINRPERGNALDGATVLALTDVLRELASDPGEVRAILLRSEGKHFCTGADIGGGPRSSEAGRPPIGHMVRSLGAGPHKLVAALWACRLPVVAELTGRTSGLGLHLALACDFAIAAQSATFAEPFAERGFNVDSGGSWLLPRFVGLTRAKRLLYLAEPVDAATAEAWGLIAEVTPDDEVDARAADLATRLAGGPTFALGTMKHLLHRQLTANLPEALEEEAAAVELTIRSEDFKEGMRAFAAKRAPEFTGR
jgi:2-(1,2-epoxy-1,2-dihydrophenyl)acetyl-CoA isomerase